MAAYIQRRTDRGPDALAGHRPIGHALGSLPHCLKQVVAVEGKVLVLRLGHLAALGPRTMATDVAVALSSARAC